MKTLQFTISRIAVILIMLTFGITASCTDKSKKKETTPKETTTETTTSTTKEVSEDNTADSNGEIALNPAHGQPGHRCDIKVGEPLNSAPEKSETNTSGSPLINAGSGKLNPAHGQPGHRCDIKVGDPL